MKSRFAGLSIGGSCASPAERDFIQIDLELPSLPRVSTRGVRAQRASGTVEVFRRGDGSGRRSAVMSATLRRRVLGWCVVGAMLAVAYVCWPSGRDVTDGRHDRGRNAASETDPRASCSCAFHQAGPGLVQGIGARPPQGSAPSRSAHGRSGRLALTTRPQHLGRKRQGSSWLTSRFTASSR